MPATRFQAPYITIRNARARVWRKSSLNAPEAALAPFCASAHICDSTIPCRNAHVTIATTNS